MKKLRNALEEFDQPIFFILDLVMVIVPVLALAAFGLARMGLPGPLSLANGQ